VVCSGCVTAWFGYLAIQAADADNRVIVERSSMKRATMMIMFAEVTAAGTAVQSGIGLGSAVAVVCSWDRNRSILWACLAGVLSWFYVIYFALTRN